jgi:hypothetical protein
MPLPVSEDFKNPVTSCAAFGRIFYGVGNRIYFSAVVEQVRQVGKCYQLNDPTSEENSDILATDGGSLPVDGAVSILRLIPLRTGVVIIAQNGCWYLAGSTGTFTATEFTLSKITDYGITHPNSAVLLGTVILYFSGSGIVSVEANEFDNLQGQLVTDTTIRTYYQDTFSERNRYAIFGAYNSRTKQVWWVDKTTGNALVLDTVLGAYYPQKFEGRPVNSYAAPSTITNEYFLCNDGVDFTVAELNDTTFKDFGIDTTAYLEAGPEALESFNLGKNVTSVAIAFQRTEQYIVDFDYDTNEFIYDTPSSCMMSTRWDTSTYYIKTSRERQAYRLNRRRWLPDSVDYPLSLDNQGDNIVFFEDKVRGNGRMVSFRFNTEPEKDLQILGFSVEYSMKGRQR